jgi:hypothetical protein
LKKNGRNGQPQNFPRQLILFSQVEESDNKI